MTEAPEPPKLPPELLASLDAFLNRKKHTTLDLETIQALPDNELEQAILDVVHAKLFAPGERENRPGHLHTAATELLLFVDSRG